MRVVLQEAAFELACCYSQLEEDVAAAEWLGRAVLWGIDQVDGLEEVDRTSDDRLQLLQGTDQYKSFRRALRKQFKRVSRREGRSVKRGRTWRHRRRLLRRWVSAGVVGPLVDGAVQQSLDAAAEAAAVTALALAGVGVDPATQSVLFERSEADGARLEKLFAMALKLEHPGIDQAGIDTMKQKVADGVRPTAFCLVRFHCFCVHDSAFPCGLPRRSRAPTLSRCGGSGWPTSESL